MIAELCTRHDVLCISDETYEWLTYDDARHFRIASLPNMWERTVTIGSGGKSFSATGWKVTHNNWLFMVVRLCRFYPLFFLFNFRLAGPLAVGRSLLF